MNKDTAISYLKNHNQTSDSCEPVTRLFYDGGTKHVENFSVFANENYMSKGLLESLRNKRSLTSEQEAELQHFTIEAILQ